MNGPTEQLIQISKNYGVYPLTKYVLEDNRFPLWSGSSKPEQHHYGKGGLSQHVLEVTQLCLGNAEYIDWATNKKIDPRLLVLASIYHDCGKMWDYQPIIGLNFSEWTGTQHKRQIHHISRSAIEWSKVADKESTLLLQAGIDSDEILHAILAHHGSRNWGSPVSPNTRLAWMLHLCDGISARMDDCNTNDRLF